MHNFSAAMKYQVDFSAFGGDSCVKRDGGTRRGSILVSNVLRKLVRFFRMAQETMK